MTSKHWVWSWKVWAEVGVQSKADDPDRSRRSLGVKSDDLVSKSGRFCGWKQTILVFTSSKQSFYSDFDKWTQMIPTNVFWFEKIRSWAKVDDLDQIFWDKSRRSFFQFYVSKQTILIDNKEWKPTISITSKFIKVRSQLVIHHESCSGHRRTVPCRSRSFLERARPEIIFGTERPGTRNDRFRKKWERGRARNDVKL